MCYIDTLYLNIFLKFFYWQKLPVTLVVIIPRNILSHHRYWPDAWRQCRRIRWRRPFLRLFRQSWGRMFTEGVMWITDYRDDWICVVSCFTVTAFSGFLVCSSSSEWHVWRLLVHYMFPLPKAEEQLTVLDPDNSESLPLGLTNDFYLSTACSDGNLNI